MFDAPVRMRNWLLAGVVSFSMFLYPSALRPAEVALLQCEPRLFAELHERQARSK